MKDVPLHSSIRLLPRFVLRTRRAQQAVRAAPIVDFARETDDRDGWVTVQIGPYQHLISMLYRLDGVDLHWFSSGDPVLPSMFCVHPDGMRSWQPQADFMRAAERVDAEADHR
jgi:hypothetical protein